MIRKAGSHVSHRPQSWGSWPHASQMMRQKVTELETGFAAARLSHTGSSTCQAVLTKKLLTTLQPVYGYPTSLTASSKTVTS